MKRLLITLFIMLPVIFSCSMPTENTNANEGESAGQTLTIESNGISMIASMGFDSAMDEEAQAGTKAEAETDGILQYLAYEGNGSYEPLIFRTDSDTMLIIGASKECYDGTVQLLSVGDDKFLCVFDRLIAISSKPSMTINEDGSITISFRNRWIDSQWNIAYMDMQKKSAYLLNGPYTSGSSDYLDFLIFDGNKDSYGFSDNMIYILADNGGLYAFRKDSPRDMVAINSGKYNPLEKNADIFTDDYVIYQYDTETLNASSGYIEVYDSTGRRPYGTTEITDSSDILDNALFRVGNSIFAREMKIDESSFSFVIYPLSIDNDLHIIPKGEGKEFVIDDQVMDGGDPTVPKNSSMFIYGDDSTLLIRAENRFAEPLLISATVDKDGNLTHINKVKITDARRYFPYPISSAAYNDGSLYWIDGNENTAIIKADMENSRLERIPLEIRLASTDISITTEGDIIYHGYINGSDVGTYLLDINTGESQMISHDRMDVHQIYEI